MEFYRNEIQIDKKVINDIFQNYTPTTRMLVFGLGYDSKMWYNRNKDTYFIENNDKFINLNRKDIPPENIIKYDYKNINVNSSFNLNDDAISEYNIPEKIKNLAPFDIILIDGPEGCHRTAPGRLIPCYWTTLLSKPGTIIYIDDSSRKLETFCINKFFKHNKKEVFEERLHCTKIIYQEL
jgi:hypothetical protein